MGLLAFDGRAGSRYATRVESAVAALVPPTAVPVDDPIRILLVPDGDEVESVRRHLQAEAHTAVEAPRAAIATAAAAIEVLRSKDADAILMHLSGWSENPLAVFARLRSEAPDTALLVIAPAAQESMALKLVQMGADDYLLSERMHRTELVRALRYAVERQRLHGELERRASHWEREPQPGGQTTRITAESYGVVPLRTALPDVLDRLSEAYARLLDLAVEQRTYRIEHDITAGLRSIADELGFLRALPRDVVDLHGTVLRQKAHSVGARMYELYAEEGRYAVLELMGHLASYYRRYSLGSRERVRPVRQPRDEGAGRP